MKYIVCEHCGATLDFGEKCNCLEEKESKLNQLLSLLSQESDGQLTIGGQTSEYYKN